MKSSAVLGTRNFREDQTGYEASSRFRLAGKMGEAGRLGWRCASANTSHLRKNGCSPLQQTFKLANQNRILADVHRARVF